MKVHHKGEISAFKTYIPLNKTMNDHSAGDNENRVEYFENATEIVCPI